MSTFPFDTIVVDDDTDLRTLTVRALVRFIQVDPERIITAVDGIDALAKLRLPDSKVSLVITDLNMPSLDGYGLIEAICKEASLRHLKILLTTSVERSQDTRLSRFLDCHPRVRYLRKDRITKDTLQAAIVTLFDR